MKTSSGAESLFRQLTPLVLLGVLLVLVFEPWLPGASWLKSKLGEQVILRGCVVMLGLYVLLLWGESLRLQVMLGGVLQALRQFDRDSSGGGRAGAVAKNSKARLEAARLLIAAMGSGDAAIRATSRHNLQRLVGQDLGDDPAAWLAWLANEESAAP